MFTGESVGNACGAMTCAQSELSYVSPIGPAGAVILLFLTEPGANAEVFPLPAQGDWPPKSPPDSPASGESALHRGHSSELTGLKLLQFGQSMVAYPLFSHDYSPCIKRRLTG